VKRILDRVRVHFARRGEWYWAPLLYTLAIAWIYRDLWHQHGAPTGLGWDTIDTHGPDLDFFARELAEGRFSLWNPYDKGGYPVFCDPVFDRYYPFNWPFATWGAVVGTSWWLVQIKVMAHHVMAAAMMHLFLRSRGLGVRAAIVGGFALIACAPLLTHKASNILWPLVWVPLVWAAIDFALARPSWRRGAAVGAALLLPMTAGSPPGLFYSALLIAPYALVRLAMHLRERENRTRDALVQIGVAAGVAVAIAGLVAAVTVLPTGELVALGSRDRFAPPGRDFALALSLRLPAAARGVFARGAGLFEMYMGAAVVMLAVCAVVMRPRADRGAPLVLFATSVFGVLLAAGATAGVLTFLVDHVSVFGMLRVPGRYKLLAAWSLAALAGYGVAALLAAEGRQRWRAVGVAGVAVAIVAVFIAGWTNVRSPNDRPPSWSLAVTALAAALVIASVWTPKRIADACLAALTVCVLLDAPLFTIVLPHAPPAAEKRQTHARDAEIVAQLDGVRDRWRVYDEFVLGERAGARLRIRDFRGYPALDPISLKRYAEVLEYTKKNPAILTDFNVRWVLDKGHFRYGDATSFVTLPHPAFDHTSERIWEAKFPAPLVQWVGKIEIVEQRKVLDAVRAVQEENGARRRAIVEPVEAARMQNAKALEAAEPDAREGTLVSYEPDAITFTIEAPRAGLVVLNEIMFPGWRVTVDGKPATPLRANYLLRAVEVEAGTHTVTWTFEPRMWRVLVGGYLLALAILTGAGVAAWRRRRRDRAET
jgi:hypothetical protein